MLEAIGKLLDLGVSTHEADKNREMSERFAKQGIRWKVADAKAAGLHPLAALGAAGASYSPTTVVSDLGSAGQSLDRAIEATRTEPERKAAAAANEAAKIMSNQEGVLRQRLLAAQIENVDADTALKNRSQPINPPMPTGGPAGIDGTGVMESPVRGKYTQNPPNVAPHAPGQPGLQAGPPMSATRLMAFDANGSQFNLRVPNTDIDALMEEPLAAAAILYALNPEVGPLVIRAIINSHRAPPRSWGRESRESSPRPPARRIGRGLGGYRP